MAGYLVLAGLHDRDRAIELRRMVLHPGARGTGAGRALPKAAITRAHQHHHARRVWLDVKAHNHRASNVDVSTVTLQTLASRWRASAAISRPCSTAVTVHPSVASERVAWPVPQPTSSTDDPSPTPVMVTRSANNSSG
ncbi:hypothetical protein Prum_092880 [Phytohabitans rumicis]|uniref:N-acetyltransferase domain-containing protein n=1 Tax=Phytohabitans rumicis TaxID=1076125 RepID=A0A6V8LN90_9ACTN|nr:GNAT family N-acetyltransferase [Phytohabitans rumicis]GFJ95646.1 hypothetical protein Prum_092880 [Phytohabitans rumicis]